MTVCVGVVYIPAAGVRAGAARAAAAGEHVPAPSSAARRHTAAAVHPALHAHAPARNNRANSALHPSRGRYIDHQLRLGYTLECHLCLVAGNTV